MTKSTTFKTATLKNGFRIVVDERPGIGFVKTGIWVKCGSVDEHPAIAGISHFIEHMVFKGTENYRQEDIKDIEKLGGVSNAYTSYDMTAYHATVFPEHFAKTFDLISDMVLFPTLSHDIDQERGAVLQEIKEYADKSSSVLINAMIRNSFRNQAISWPILGSRETVSAMTSSTLVAYHAAHYTPKNMVLAVSGDITFEEVMAVATGKLEDVPAFENRPRPAFRHTGGETVLLPYSGEDMKGWICFPGISRNDPDHAAVAIMSHILNHRLNDEIRENRKIACSISSGPLNYANADSFVVGTFGSPETIQQVLPVLLREIRNIQKSVRPGEIALARDSLRMQFVQGLEDPEDMCMAIGPHMIVSGTLFDPQAELKASATVAAQDVRRAARRIFSGLPSMTFMGATLPLPTPQEIQAMAKPDMEKREKLPAPGITPRT